MSRVSMERTTQHPNHSYPGLRTGLLVGAMVTAPIIALFFAADVIFGLPLLPLDLIDWAARNLPGNLITVGIDAIVSANETLNLGRTDEVAKLIEQMMGVAVLFIVGVIAGGVFFAVLKRRRTDAEQAAPWGILAGLMLGLPLAVLSGSVNFTATSGPVLSFAWIVAAYVLWGMGIAWVYADTVRVSRAALIKAEVAEMRDTREISAEEVAAAPGEAATSAATVSAAQVHAMQIDRRQFLVRVGGATATLTVAGAGLNLIFSRPAESETLADTPQVSQTLLPTRPDDSLVPAPGTRSEYTPLEQHYRIDISARPPVIDGSAWTLPITGLVNKPVDLTLDEIMAYESQDLFVTLSCVSNRIAGDLISTTRWTGVSFQKIIELIQPTAEGRYARITAADGFDEYMPLSVAEADSRVMLAYHWDGRPLLQKHGFPLRIYIPDLYGMKQPKWITGIEIVEFWDEGYWVRRGWSESARVQTTAVVDTVAGEAVYEGEDGVTYVPVGGIAYAGARGISRVEVSVDGGEWQETQLKTPLSDLTWVIWRYDWPFEEGLHAFEVRTVDGNGVPQIERETGVRPDGATGIHRFRARL